MLKLRLLKHSINNEISELSNNELLELYGLLNYEKNTENIIKQVEEEVRKRKEDNKHWEGKYFLSTINNARLQYYYNTIQGLCEVGVLNLDENVQESINMMREEFSKRKVNIND